MKNILFVGGFAEYDRLAIQLVKEYQFLSCDPKKALTRYKLDFLLKLLPTNGKQLLYAFMIERAARKKD